MSKVITALLALLLPLQAFAAQPAAGKKPGVVVGASLVTKTGDARTFDVPGGTVEWTPALPLYAGDRLTVSFAPANSIQPSRVTVTLDGRPLADLRKPPWQVVVDTSKLSPGQHVVRGDVRFPTNPRAYSIADYKFFIQEPPAMVKGTVEEVGTGPTAPGTRSTSPREFVPPPESLTNSSIRIRVRSLESDVDGALPTGGKIAITRPTRFYIQAPRGVDRWAYSLTRDGRQVAGAGPVGKMVYLEIVPKHGDVSGVLPGDVTLKVWGVRNDGVYSQPVTVPLLIH